MNFDISCGVDGIWTKKNTQQHSKTIRSTITNRIYSRMTIYIYTHNIYINIKVSLPKKISGKTMQLTHGDFTCSCHLGRHWFLMNVSGVSAARMLLVLWACMYTHTYVYIYILYTYVCVHMYTIHMQMYRSYRYTSRIYVETSRQTILVSQFFGDFLVQILQWA